MLVVAGIDPGGGAGIAADVRASALAGAFVAPVVATITVQSTSGFVTQRAVSTPLVVAQAREVLTHQRALVIKTGALGSAANVRAVARLVRAHALPLVVDPVRVPSRIRARSGASHGAALLDDSGVAAIRDALVPCATLVTANADEASALTGVRVRDRASARRAARALVDAGARAALVKGGHVDMRAASAVDVLAIGERIVELSAPRLTLPPLHGGGCVLGTLIASRLARKMLALTQHSLDRQTLRQTDRQKVADPSDAAIERAVRWSRDRHHALLERALVDVGGTARVISP